MQLLRLKHLNLISHLHRWVWLRQDWLDRWELLTVDEWHELASYSLVPWLILRCLLSKVFLVFTKWSVIHAKIFFRAAFQLVQIEFWYAPLINIKLGRCFKLGTRSLWLLLDREDLIIKSGRKLGMVDLALLHQLGWAHLQSFRTQLGHIDSLPAVKHFTRRLKTRLIDTEYRWPLHDLVWAAAFALRCLQTSHR